MIPLALECRHVSKCYRSGVLALDDISFTVAPGAFAVLIGPSGSGKTTLLAIAGSLDRPTGGAVLFAGQDDSRHSDAGLARIRRRIGFVAQDFASIPGLPVWENVTYPLIPRGVSRSERRRIAAALLDRLALGGQMTKKPSALSGGELQRVAIARALAVQPEVILADEPSSNLDDDSGRLVLGLFLERRAAGTTLLISSHDPRLLPHATQIIDLAAGKLMRS